MNDMIVQPVIVKYGPNRYQAVMRVTRAGDVGLGYHTTAFAAENVLANARALMYITDTTATIMPIIQESVR